MIDHVSDLIGKDTGDWVVGDRSAPGDSLAAEANAGNDGKKPAPRSLLVDVLKQMKGSKTAKEPEYWVAAKAILARDALKLRTLIDTADSTVLEFLAWLRKKTKAEPGLVEEALKHPRLRAWPNQFYA